MGLIDVFKQCKEIGLQNDTIIDNLARADSKINSPLYDKIVCSVSGGSDSDIMVDICTKCDDSNKVIYIYSLIQDLNIRQLKTI